MYTADKSSSTDFLQVPPHIQRGYRDSLTGLNGRSEAYHIFVGQRRTSLDPVAIVDSSSFRDESALPGTIDIFPRVGESIMHQALPVPDWMERSTVRRDRAAIMSREF